MTASIPVTAGTGFAPQEGHGMDLIKKLWLLWTSLGAVVLGFITLAAGMLTVGPVLLVLGYCVLLPFFLWRSFQDSVGE